MKNVDFIIPLFGGAAMWFFPEKMVKQTDVSFNKKVSLIKKCGMVLILVSILYYIIGIFS